MRLPATTTLWESGVGSTPEQSSTSCTVGVDPINPERTENTGTRLLGIKCSQLGKYGIHPRVQSSKMWMFNISVYKQSGRVDA